jgi:cytochrome c peroxidase
MGEQWVVVNGDGDPTHSSTPASTLSVWHELVFFSTPAPVKQLDKATDTLDDRCSSRKKKIRVQRAFCHWHALCIMGTWWIGVIVLNSYIKSLGWILTFSLTCGISCRGEARKSRDAAEIRQAARSYGMGALVEARAPKKEWVDLGRQLFFDRELSGNRDVACATCHHPRFASSDALPTSVGTGGKGLGETRLRGTTRTASSRNAPALWNAGLRTTMLWDLRIETLPDGKILVPGIVRLPRPIKTALQAQALLPVLARDEMRGERGDLDIKGKPNELADIFDSRPEKVWSALIDRLTQFQGYRLAFALAFPKLGPDELGFEHAAIALAAYQSHTFFRSDTPWDRFLRGDDDALKPAEKRGAKIFLGRGRCASCHGGSLLTDDRAHNLAIPQLGGGRGAFAPLDVGLQARSGDPRDRFRFRTPSLRQVETTGPWMHNGAYEDLRGAVLHHLDPKQALDAYLRRGVTPPHARELIKDDQTRADLLSNVDSKLQPPITLTHAEVADLLSFLSSLTSPSWENVIQDIPSQVPSGLTVDR